MARSLDEISADLAFQTGTDQAYIQEVLEWLREGVHPPKDNDIFIPVTAAAPTFGIPSEVIQKGISSGELVTRRMRGEKYVTIADLKKFAEKKGIEY